MEHWALITGAAGGLGKAFAVECAGRGWNICISDLRREPLETLAVGIRNTYGVKAMVQPADLTDPASRDGLFRAICAARVRFRTLINVAGVDYEGMFYERTGDQIRAIIRLNIEATLEITHAMLEHRDLYSTFRIITIASLAAYFPMPVKATYAASKRFLLDFSLALREEVRPLGATVTVVCPGGLATTPGAIQGIAAQGLMGQLTTVNIGTVAAGSIEYALRGKAVYIPGFWNRLLQFASGLLPISLIVSLIGQRWREANESQPRVALNPRPDQLQGG